MLNTIRHKAGWVIIGGLLAGASLGVSARTDGAPAAEGGQKSVVAQVAPNAEFPEKAQVGGRTVRLNGAGTRYKAVFQVYRAALYTEKPVQQYSELVNDNGAKRIHLVMMRGINADELGSMFIRGMQENMDKSSSARLMPAMLRMSALFSQYKRLEVGDSVTMDWVPGKGMVAAVRGTTAAEPIPEPQFYHALSGIWLGATPADWKLRDAMLGVKATTDTANRN